MVKHRPDKNKQRLIIREEKRRRNLSIEIKNKFVQKYATIAYFIIFRWSCDTDVITHQHQLPDEQENRVQKKISYEIFYLAVFTKKMTKSQSINIKEAR